MEREEGKEGKEGKEREWMCVKERRVFIRKHALFVRREGLSSLFAASIDNCEFGY
jgi:hypothetical protein